MRTMSMHWRLAARFAGLICVVAVVAAVVLWRFHGDAHAGALLYGAFIGLVSFLSTAASVSLLTGGSVVGRMLGACSFFMRYGFVAGALGVPAYFEVWPVVAMLGGFAGVYLFENVMLLPGMLAVMGRSRAGRAGRSRSERVERRVAV
jgi:hypothetical protein